MSSSVVNITILNDRITISGRMYVNGYPLQFDESGFQYAGVTQETGSFNMRIEPTVKGNIFIHRDLGSVFEFISEEGPLIETSKRALIKINLSEEMWKNPIE